MEEEPKKLTAKQLRFIDEYTVDFNAKQAAIRSGYSVATAKEMGYENLTKPHVIDAISKKVGALTMSADEALVRMSDYARGSFQPFLQVDKDENIILVLTSDEAQSKIHLIKKIKQTKRILNDSIYDVTTEIEIHDSKDAVSKVLQLHGRLIDRKVTVAGKIETLTEDEIEQAIDEILKKRQ